MKTIRAINVAIVVSVSPVLLVTLQTLRAAWSRDSVSSVNGESVDEKNRLDEMKSVLAGGPAVIRTRMEIEATLPVTEFFRPGFTTIPVDTSAVTDGDEQAWEEMSVSFLKLKSSREAFEIADRHIGQRALTSLSNEQLSSFASELKPAVGNLPALRDWPNRLDEMSKEAAATKTLRIKLDTISRELASRIDTGSALTRIADAELRHWSQQLADLKSPKSDSASIDNYPTLAEQHQELKRRVDFWTCWNPPTPIGNANPTAAMLESRRAALIRLAAVAKDSSIGEAKLPEESDQAEKVTKEIDRLAGEVLYVQLKEALASKSSVPKSMADLLARMEPIIATGTHRDDLLKIFKAYVEHGISMKTKREPKLPVYDFHLTGGQIWLAHSEGKVSERGPLWIWSYDLEKDETIKVAMEHQYLYPDSGFSKITDPEETRIVKEFNEARGELLDALDQVESWKAMQSKCVAQEMQLAAYYRQMKQFWKQPETGKHRLAPDLSFTADQKLISDVLEHWRIVESLYRR